MNKLKRRCRDEPIYANVQRTCAHHACDVCMRGVHGKSSLCQTGCTYICKAISFDAPTLLSPLVSFSLGTLTTRRCGVFLFFLSSFFLPSWTTSSSIFILLRLCCFSHMKGSKIPTRMCNVCTAANDLFYILMHVVVDARRRICACHQFRGFCNLYYFREYSYTFLLVRFFMHMKILTRFKILHFRRSGFLLYTFIIT